MKRDPVFTSAYELIICVTPFTTGSEVACDHSTLDPMVFRRVLQCEIQRKETSYLFFKMSTNVTGDKCETILLI